MSNFPVASTLLLLGIVSVLIAFLFIPVDFRPEEEEDTAA
jgi:hypothetical protein